MPIDILLYAVIAAVLVFWLHNTLGTKNGEERDRSDILEQLRERQQNQREEKMSGKVIDITDSVTDITTSEKPVLDGVDIDGEETAREILDLIKYDGSFHPRRFVDGAKEAFAMIVESFAKGDLKTLKMLLSDGVYTAFEQEIEDRRARGETLITDVLAVRQCRILSIRRLDRMTYIKMRFLAEETMVVRDREGNIVSGHPDKVISMNDVWTFGRDLKSKDPTWYLVETSDDVAEVSANPIPDAK